MKKLFCVRGSLATWLLMCSCALSAQVATVHPLDEIDPSRAVVHVQTVSSFHAPLWEEYVWTANDAAVATGEKQLSQLKRDDWKVEPHFFRTSFLLKEKPAAATLYIAGPRAAKVFVNGLAVANLKFAGGHHMGFGTMRLDVSASLRTGENVFAVEAVRGFGSHHHTNALKTSWLNSGEVLAVKIVPAEEGVEAPALLISNGGWKSSTRTEEGWEKSAFDDSRWNAVVSLGGIESSPDFFQWNADAGMFDWPGYFGAAPYMAAYRLEPVKTERRVNGLLLDFGRELSGRLVVSAGHTKVTARVRYGESLGELLKSPYLGETVLHAPAGGEARGPKSGWRYALVAFDGDAAGARISAESIYYPVTQVGEFKCNDERVNQIWNSAVYTAHLAMQDSILDGIKRDRGRWIGDDEVINRVVLDVYGNVPLVKAGLEEAIGPRPVTDAVNGLPGYSAWWVVAEYEYVMRTGDVEQLRGVKARMLELLWLMAKDVDSRNVYAGKGKPFVDWSKGFSGDSMEARRAVHFEYLLAFRKAAVLMGWLREDTERARYTALADAMGVAAAKYLEDADGTFGDRWQTNALFYLAELRSPLKVPDSGVVWQILKRTTTGRKAGDVITPYFGSYLLSAMAGLGGSHEGLQWIRSYWGGMLDDGATSFWEAWDPAWAGDDPHARLEADDKVGYNASLAHGWSSGPAAWLLEEVLGVKAVSPGYRRVQVRPQLSGLEWVKGAVATPLGAVKVEASASRIVVAVPDGMEVEMFLPMGVWTRNGVKANRIKGSDMKTSGIGETVVTLKRGGRFEFVKQ